MAVLLSAGAHVPVIPLLEVVGSGASVWPRHIGAIEENAGTVMIVLTVIISTAVMAHCPALGVKV